MEALNKKNMQEAKMAQTSREQLEAKIVYDVKKYVENLDMKVRDLAKDLGNNFPGALKGISDTVAQRVDALEVIIKRYALEANASAALSKAQADRIASLDTAVADRMAAIDARLQGALALVDAAVKAQNDRVGARLALRPEDEQKLKGYFEHIDKELSTIKTAMADPLHKQKILDEMMRMVQDMDLLLKVEYGNMLSTAVAALAMPGMLWCSASQKRLNPSRSAARAKAVVSSRARRTSPPSTTGDRSRTEKAVMSRQIGVHGLRFKTFDVRPRHGRSRGQPVTCPVDPDRRLRKPGPA